MDPFRIDLDRARREAKALVAAARAGEPDALAALRRDRSPRLADAQHAVARRHGFRRWVDLVTATEDPGAALRRAARLGDDEGLYALLEHGAPPNAADPRTGRTALHVAAVADQLDVVAALVGWHPVDLHAVDRSGRNALDLALPASPVAAVLASCGLGPARPPLGDGHASLAHTAELALYEHLSRAPGVTREPIGDGYLFRTGLVDNTRNVVVCDRLSEGIEAVVDRMRDVPSTWIVRSAAADDDLIAELRRVGCQPERRSIHMVASTDAIVARRDERIREVRGVAAFDLLDPGEAALLDTAGPPVRHLALGDAALVSWFASGTTVLGLHLHVRRAQRRRGLARSLVQHLAAVARDEGLTHAVLAPTPATVPFYERLGFTLERSLDDVCWYLPQR